MLIVTFALCHIVRSIARPFLKGNAAKIFGEFMAIFQLSCCLQELALTDHQFSVNVRMLRLFSTLLATTYVFDGYTGNVGWISEILVVHRRVLLYLALLVAQLLGGFTAYHVTPYYFPQHYFQVLDQDRSCQSPDPIHRLYIEFIGTLLLFLLDWYTRRYKELNRYSQLVYLIMITYLYYGSIDVYLNPISARTMTLQCSSDNLTQHLLIYWAAPIAAIILSLAIIRLISGTFDIKVKED